MLNQNKKKTDSRVRFQNNRFKGQLKAQRNYKRSARNVPKTEWAVFLAKVGLGSWLSRLATGLVFLLIIYIVFIPNPFFIKNIIVNDSDSASQPAVQNLVASFLNKDTPWPQKNLLLTSKTKLKNFLLQNDKQVVSVDSINKKLPSTLVLSVTPRVDEFSVITASSTAYSVSNDGIVTGELLPNASGTLPTLPFLVKLTQTGDLTLGQTILSAQEISFIKNLQGELPGIIKSPIDHYEMTDLVTPDLDVYMKTGLQVKFDSTSDLAQALSRLSLVLSQLQPGDIKNLYYMDMRFEDRGYVCYLNTPCANQIIIPNLPATTTPDTIGN